MSRTYRRKKGKNTKRKNKFYLNRRWSPNRPPYWVTHECKKVGYRIKKFEGKKGEFDAVVYRWEWVKKEGKNLDKSIAKYYSDSESGMWSVPSWFVNSFFERKFRQKNRRECKKLLRHGDWEEGDFPDKHKGAGWSWW